MNALGSTIVMLGIGFFIVALCVLLPVTLWVSKWISKKIHIPTNWKKNIIIHTIQIFAFFMSFFLIKRTVDDIDFYQMLPIILFAFLFPIVIGSIIFKVFYKSTYKEAFLYASSISATILFIYISLTLLLQLLVMLPL